MKINKFMFILILPVLFASVVFSVNAFARPVSGDFKATSSCNAYLSISKKNNPDKTRIVPGQEYAAVEVNDQDKDWVRINIPGAKGPLRWISSQCGTLNLEQDKATQPKRHDQAQPERTSVTKPRQGPAVNDACSTGNQHDSYVLALTWQPGFCKHYPYKGNKPECNAIKNGELVVDHLTIHGLWPNRKGCGSKYGDCAGPKLELEASTVARIAPWMPNFLYDRRHTFGNYEWDKHGTCQGRSDDEYFLTMLQLAQAVDGSIVGTQIRANRGKNMSASEFFTNIEKAHGREVAERITLVCAEGKYLQEIRINLPLAFTIDPDLALMTRDAAATPVRKDGCRGDALYVEPGRAAH